MLIQLSTKILKVAEEKAPNYAKHNNLVLPYTR